MVEVPNKGRFRRKPWILLGGAIAVLLTLTLLLEREPRYNGRSLGEWVWKLEADSTGFSVTNAEQAIEHIGTNALPFLIKWVQYEEKPWRRRLGDLCDKLPDQLATRRLNDWVAGRGVERQQGAFSALYILGPKASPAIPTLVHLVETQPDTIQHSMTALARIGGEGLTPVIDALTNPASLYLYRLSAINALDYAYWRSPIDQRSVPVLADCLQDKNRDVAFRAAQILCCHDSQKELAMKTLLDGLESGTPRIRQQAGDHLKVCLKRGYSVPEVLHFLQDTNSPLSPYAAAALIDLADDGMKLPPTVLSALTNSLHDPRPSVRSYAVCAIIRFSKAAEPAAPALLDLWNDPDNTVRQSATNAFYGLPSYSFLRSLGQWPIGMSQQQADMWITQYGPCYTELTNLLNHPDPRIRQMATNAFQTLRGSNRVNQTHADASR